LLKPKRKSQRECREYQLCHGSLLVMGGSLQHHFRHGVPRENRPVGARINVTFRLLVSAPS
jgi:alkylated DNA repair dioxygenase AlkB